MAAVRRRSPAHAPLVPRWLAQVMSTSRTPVPWVDMVRHALSVAGPIIIGFIVGEVALGGLVALGSWLAADSDRGGSLLQRVTSMSLGVLASVVGLVLGRLTASDAAASLLVLAVVAVAAAVMSAMSADLSTASLQMLIYFAVGAGPLVETPGEELVLATLAGGVWSVGLSCLQTLVQPPRDVPRRAVVTVLDALVVLVRTQGRDDDRPRTSSVTAADGATPVLRRLEGPRAGVSTAIARAYDALVTARSRSQGQRHDLDRLGAVLDAANGVATSLLARSAQTLDPDHAEELLRRLRGARADVERRPAEHRTDAERSGAPTRPPASGAARSPVDAAMTALERTVVDDAPGAGGQDRWPWDRPSRREPVLRTVLGPTTTRYAFRLGVTLLAAQALALAVPVERSYWVLMTAVLVIKPDFGSIFARGVQRMIGTLAGAVLGSLVLALTPTGAWIILPLLALAFLLPLAERLNYALMAVFLTPLVAVFSAVSAEVGTSLLVERAVNTVIGAVVVLVVGYLAWPSAWRSRMDVDVASFVDDMADFARVALVGTPAVVVPARRRAQGALTDLRTRLQSALAEPTPVGRSAATWFPLITSLGRAVDDLVDASVIATGVRASGLEPADPGDGERVERWLRELAAAVRAGREPADLELPGEGPLAVAAEDLRSARRTMVDSGRSTPEPAQTPRASAAATA